MLGALVWAVVLLAGTATAETLGSPSGIQEFPSIVQVEFHVSTGWVQHCAGSVLTSAHILSTASCFSGPDYSPENRRVRAGSAISGVGGQVKSVQYAISHPNYGLLGLDSDIAVVTLGEYLTLGDDVKQVLILGQGIELPLGLKVRHAGWGFTAEGKEVTSPDLYALDLEVNDENWCLIQYLTHSESRPDITENMLCVGLTYISGRDFDTNDLGTPLFFEDVLVGILAHGEIADDQMPIVATNVGSFSGWIVETASS